MRLPQLIGAMVFVAAQASCLNTCKMGCDVSASTGSSPFVDPGGTAFPHFKNDCSTCGHSDITTNWTYSGTPSPGGRIRVAIEFECLNDGKTGTYNIPRSVFVPETRLDYHEVGVKNVCGEDAPIAFLVRVINESDVEIEATSTIACPLYKAPAAAVSVSPSRAGR